MIPHGTREGYNTHRCRCEECKQAAREYRQEFARHGVVEHGTVKGYTHKYCRCEACKQAYSAYRKVIMARVRSRPVPKHNISGYRYGCRCEICVQANRVVLNRWRSKGTEKPRGPRERRKPIHVVRRRERLPQLSSLLPDSSQEQTRNNLLAALGLKGDGK